MGFKINNTNRHNKRRVAISEINITPFVDILLVLLIIFMVAAPMMTSGVNIELPQGVATPETDKNKSITISIKSNQDIYIDDVVSNISNLASRLIVVSGEDLSTKIHIRADKNLDYGIVMEAVKIINLAGFSQVILVTELIQ